jgi:hypothetical protein
MWAAWPSQKIADILEIWNKRKRTEYVSHETGVVTSGLAGRRE